MSSERAIQKILSLKERRKAVILAHNYQAGEIQDLADFTGDSLGLSILAAQTDAETIVFCGVRFMAETAAILSPQKTVLLPDLSAGCSLAATITAAQLRAWKAEHPGAVVVSYVNTTAEVKAESDYCCTSGNAKAVIEAEAAELAKGFGFFPQGMGKRVLILSNSGGPGVIASDCADRAGLDLVDLRGEPRQHGP